MISIILYALYFICGGISGYQLRCIKSMLNHNKFDDISTPELEYIVQCCTPIIEENQECVIHDYPQIIVDINTELFARKLTAETNRKNNVAKYK